MPAVRRAKGWRKAKKPGNKNTNPPYPLMETALLSRIERDQARLAALRAEKAGVEAVEEAAVPERDEAENRVVVKFFWKQSGSPTCMVHECLKSSLAFRKPAVAAASRRPARVKG